MVAEVFAGISAFKTMFDITKAFKDMDTATARNAAVIGLQEKIFAAQAAYAELAGRVGELEAEVRSFKTWETEKQRYELKGLARGFLAYVLKKPERATATPHAICTNCYERSFKSMLQSNGALRVADHRWLCPSCKTAYACEEYDMARMISELDGTNTKGDLHRIRTIRNEFAHYAPRDFKHPKIATACEKLSHPKPASALPSDSSAETIERTMRRRFSATVNFIGANLHQQVNEKPFSPPKPDLMP